MIENQNNSNRYEKKRIILVNTYNNIIFTINKHNIGIFYHIDYLNKKCKIYIITMIVTPVTFNDVFLSSSRVHTSKIKYIIFQIQGDSW